MTNVTDLTPFQLAVQKIGNQRDVAKKLTAALGRSITPQAVNNALLRNPSRCPDGWALALSSLSGIPKSRLRPDVYPPRRTEHDQAKSN